MASSDLQEIQEKFGGTWVLDRSENFKELLEEFEVGFLLKNMAQKVTPTMIICVKDGKVEVTRKGFIKDSVVQIELGVTKEMEEFGYKVTTVVTYEDGKIIGKNKPKDGEKSSIKEHTATREINDKGEMVQTLVVTSSGLTCKRIFKRK